MRYKRRKLRDGELPNECPRYPEQLAARNRPPRKPARFRRPLGRGLVITRKIEECFALRTAHGAEVFVTVTQLGGDRVKLHIEAPREVSILRNELAASELRKAGCGDQPQAGHEAHAAIDAA